MPDSPNAVSSQATSAYHAIDPLTYAGTREAALDSLVEIVKALPRTTIVTRRDDYLYAEFASALLGFVDDVEFYLPPEPKIVHVRSASRLGHSDLGVNRTRIEEIRRRFKAKSP